MVAPPRRVRDALSEAAGDERGIDAGRLDDVDGVDADAGRDVGRRRGIVPRDVGPDDGSDDAAVAGPHARRYRQLAGATGEPRATPVHWLTAVVGAAYLLVWSAVGAVAFPVGVALAAIEMRQPALARLVPVAAGVAVLIGGALQRSAWKARQLARCRAATRLHLGERCSASAAWRYGRRLGVHCVCSCAGPMTILLGLGLMDLPVMAVVTAAITIERLAPSGVRVARSTGALAVGAGLFLIVRAVALG